ncbi:cytochrome c oxidase subunit IV [Athelia psychrophila]|uniref:Cytochrome c oxidase subunit IV n=1 Tax=Athelia psychrophila TaxID=1759441 RepID=A0A166GYQ9_9AGAM|nr:cytochrome c oxidase subunit IV [Fibularhizoctonia sp. CBS 109695]
MQAIRLARPRTSLSTSPLVRSLATTAAPGAHVASSSTATKAQSVIPLSNVEAQWATMNAEDKALVHQQIDALQKKDWKELSIDERKASYYVAFGPHGPRTPTNKPGDNLKIALATIGLSAIAGAVFLGFRALGPAPPRTITKEWEEAANERGKELKLNPITGIASEGYTGKGFVSHK